MRHAINGVAWEKAIQSNQQAVYNLPLITHTTASTWRLWPGRRGRGRTRGETSLTGRSRRICSGAPLSPGKISTRVSLSASTFPKVNALHIRSGTCITRSLWDEAFQPVGCLLGAPL